MLIAQPLCIETEVIKSFCETALLLCEMLSQVGQGSVSLAQTQQAVLPAGAPGHSYESSVLCCQFFCVYTSRGFTEFRLSASSLLGCMQYFFFIDLKHEAVKRSKMGNLESWLSDCLCEGVWGTDWHILSEYLHRSQTFNKGCLQIANQGKCEIIYGNVTILLSSCSEVRVAGSSVVII